MDIIIWILVGAVAGWLAGRVIRGYSMGLLESIFVGIIGSFLGRWLFSLLRVPVPGGITGEVIIAFCGAVVVLLLVRMLRRV